MRKSNNYYNRKNNREMKQRTGTKNKAKKIKSNSCTRSNKESPILLLQYGGKQLFDIFGAPIIFSPAAELKYTFIHKLL